jgi:ribonuclease HII
LFGRTRLSRGAYPRAMAPPPAGHRESGAPGELLLGLDEAGRGSVLGPLVVGGFLTTSERLPALRALGVRDSKELSPIRRSEIFEHLPDLGRCVSLRLSPLTIDAAVRTGSLNRLEARAFAQLTRQTRPSRIYIDACDPVAERFGREVAGLARVPPDRVDARHKADRDLTIVGAGSIVAKVLRDQAIARLARQLGTQVGSGYPADPITREFVRATLSDGGPVPPFMRASWKTTATLMPRPTARPLESFVP